MTNNKVGNIVDLGEDAERARFEAHFSQAPYEWRLSLSRDRDTWPGQYVSYAVECAWQAWLAAKRDTP